MKNLFLLSILIALALMGILVLELLPHATYEERSRTTFSERESVRSLSDLNPEHANLLVEKEIAMHSRKLRHDILMDYLWFIGAFAVALAAVVLHHRRVSGMR